MQRNAVQHKTIMCCVDWNISWTCCFFSDQERNTKQQFTQHLPFWKHREQEQRKSYSYSMQVRMKTRHGCVMQFTTPIPGQTTRLSSIADDTAHASHHGDHTFNLDTQHRTKQTQRSPPPPAGSMMDELSNNGLGYTLNSPQGQQLCHTAATAVTLAI